MKIVHRDLKLDNILVNFPNVNLHLMTEKEQYEFFWNLDLNN
jgi:serine/threonine protein kinase